MKSFKIAFVSGKLGDVDGVSLEVDKWIEVLQDLGHEIFTISGKYAKPVKNVAEDNQLLLEPISFNSEKQRYYETLVFPFLNKRPTRLSEGRIHEIENELMIDGEDAANTMYEFIKKNNIDVIVAQNTNAMPMTLIGGVAVYLLSTEKRVATIFHHHDFWWERSRFSSNYIEGLLNRIMPPTDIATEHVVISSYAAHILTSLKRVSPHIVPNCEDFDNAVVRDEYNSDFRKELGFSDDDIIFLQPTRIVPRKKIEDSVRLVGLFAEKYPEYKDRIRFVISLYQGDELDSNYITDIEGLANRLGVSIHLISDRVSSIRCNDENGKKMYTNRDVLVNADIVTYLPVWEGFGNALLEAVAARVPVVTTTYLVYKTDIQGCGMNNIEVRDKYDRFNRLIFEDSVMEKIKLVLENPDVRKEMVETNFRIADEEFGFRKLKSVLYEVLDAYGDEIMASRRRLEKSKEFYSV